MSELNLTPSRVNAFWQGLTPAIHKQISDLESAEAWTYEYSELPDFFGELESLLPDVASFPLDGDMHDILDGIVEILASVTFTTCIAALAYLERHALKQNDGKPGWGMTTFFHASVLAMRSDEKGTRAKVVRERVNTLVRSGLNVKIFLRAPISD